MSHLASTYYIRLKLSGAFDCVVFGLSLNFCLVLEEQLVLLVIVINTYLGLTYTSLNQHQSSSSMILQTIHQNQFLQSCVATTAAGPLSIALCSL